MARLIDIHTHRTSENSLQVFSLKNIILPQQQVPEKGFYSTGWHPWFIENYPLTEMEKTLRSVCCLPQIIAIGECGLDRAINTPMEVQMKVFEFHLKLAQLNNKPLIIHAVRSYSDVLQALKKMNFRLPVIFHDYRGNEQQTKQLLQFNSYFSFGESLVKQQPIKEKIRHIPTNRLFLETDESELSIEKIYLSAASVLGTSLEDLSEQLLNNFKTIFGDELVEQN